VERFFTLHLLHEPTWFSRLQLPLPLRPRLSFIAVVVLVDLIFSDAVYHNHTFTTPDITHTVKMKYQLIALPALAATVAAQDLYVDISD
jgi:branched-subunit amino acid transport protein